MTSAHVRDDTLANIEEELRAVVEGTIHVIDVRATRDWDSDGDERVRLVITLEDPADETWPSNEMTRLSQRVRQVGYDLGLDMNVTYTNPTSGTEDEPVPLEEDDGPTVVQ